jgi:hypothetical protein
VYRRDLEFEADAFDISSMESALLSKVLYRSKPGENALLISLSRFIRPGNTSESRADPIPPCDLFKIAEKLERACEYKLMNRYVELPYGLRTFIGHPDEIRLAFDGEQLFDLGPGFKVKCVRKC